MYADFRLFIEEWSQRVKVYQGIGNLSLSFF